MKDLFKRISALAVIAALLFTFASCGILEDVIDDTSELQIVSGTDAGKETVTDEKTDITPVTDEPTETETETEPVIDKIAEDGVYTSKEDVALYIHTYGKLPSNFITKAEAQKLGWSGGGLDGYADGKCIGGDYFGNYEGNLPKKDGRKYTECDIDTLHAKSRGAKRIIFSNDGLIFYTEDHYETFEQLY